MMKKKGSNNWNVKVTVMMIVFILFIMVFVIWRVTYDKAESTEVWTIEAIREYCSKTLEADCVICQVKSQHNNEENIGMIFLNEGKHYYVGINCYDDLGNLVTKKEESMQTQIVPMSGERKGIKISVNVNRKYANIDIRLNKEKTIDAVKAGKHCCESCLESLGKDYYSVTPYDIVVLNYSANEMHLLTSNIRAFSTGDYYVTCEQRSYQGETGVSALDLFVVYCPE